MSIPGYQRDLTQPQNGSSHCREQRHHVGKAATYVLTANQCEQYAIELGDTSWFGIAFFFANGMDLNVRGYVQPPGSHREHVNKVYFLSQGANPLCSET